MSERAFSEVLNHCIDRIAAGESIESCLQDFPEHAERLGDLLQMGELVHQAVYPDTEVTDAQARVHREVLEAMSTYASGKRKRKNRELERRHERIVMLAAAAATILILLGIALLTTLQRDDAPGSVALNYTDTAQLAAQQTETENACQTLTEVAELAMAATQTPSELVTFEVKITTTPMSTPTRPLPTVIPFSYEPDLTPTPEPQVVATSVALMSPEPPSAETATAIAPALQTPVVTFDSVPLPTATQVPMVVTAGVGTAIPATPTPMPTPTALGTRPPDATMAPMGTPIPMFTPTQVPLVASTTPVGLLPEIMPLTAGEIDDNADWDTYLTYRSNYLRQYPQSVYDVDVTGRQIIRVVDGDGLPVIGARVRVYMGEILISETCTYADGRTLFFPNADGIMNEGGSYRVVVDKDDAVTEFTLDVRQDFRWDVVLEDVVVPRDPVQLDVLFLLDTTSSMLDEIAELQNNILHISSQIDSLPGNVDARYGLVVYRDHGNFEYLVRRHDFTNRVDVFQQTLNNVQANSGDNNYDWPEALNEAMFTALHEMSWRDDNTVKLVFLVSDARPHINHPAEAHRYSEEMAFAAQNGIKIHPIGSSGLEPAGEFIFRQIAQYTMGHFIFLTYDDSVPGTPGSNRDDLNVGQPDDPTTVEEDGDYTVEQLDDLVLRLITDELAALRGEAAETASESPTVIEGEQPPCVVEIRPPPPGAPTLVPSGQGQETRYVDPHVAVCMPQGTVIVGNVFRIYAQAVDVGMPVYQLRLTDGNGAQGSVRINPSTMVVENLEIPTGLELVGVEVINTWNVAFVLRARQPGMLEGSVYASGEIHYGYPGPATWSGGNSDVFSFEVLGG